MAFVDWEIKAREFANCNCDYGCPCQFNALPTYGDCQAIVGMVIDEGHFGDTKLDGFKTVSIMKWPGPVHEGNGVAQTIIDERADEAQRAAIVTIFSGEETEPGTTGFNVFAATFTEVHDPVFAAIDFEVDVDARKAHMAVDGLIEGRGEPIVNPITGEEHRARIELPNGFEYTIAEMGSGTSTSTGPIKIELDSSYGQFARLHMTQNGVVRPASG